MWPSRIQGYPTLFGINKNSIVHQNIMCTTVISHTANTLAVSYKFTGAICWGNQQNVLGFFTLMISKILQIKMKMLFPAPLIVTGTFYYLCLSYVQETEIKYRKGTVLYFESLKYLKNRKYPSVDKIDILIVPD